MTWQTQTQQVSIGLSRERLYLGLKYCSTWYKAGLFTHLKVWGTQLCDTRGKCGDVYTVVKGWFCVLKRIGSVSLPAAPTNK